MVDITEEVGHDDIQESVRCEDTHSSHTLFSSSIGAFLTRATNSRTPSPPISPTMPHHTLLLFIVLFVSLSVAKYSHVCVLFHQSKDSRDSLPVTALSSNIADSNNEEQKLYPPANSSLQQYDKPMLIIEHKYRIHVGTQPAYYTEKYITFEESQSLHLETIDLLENFLISSNVKCEIIRKDAFSNSAWELEPYACIILTCSNKMAKGLAAIIGLILRPYAIGIYTDNDDCCSHSVFTVLLLDNSSITKTDALHIMKMINEDYKHLSAQFDSDGRVLKLHHFDNEDGSQTTSKQLMEIINDYFENDLFQVEQSVGKSSLLEETDYEKIIKKQILLC